MLQSYNDKITQQKRAQTTNRLTCTDDPLLTCTNDPPTLIIYIYHILSYIYILVIMLSSTVGHQPSTNSVSFSLLSYQMLWPLLQKPWHRLDRLRSRFQCITGTGLRTSRSWGNSWGNPWSMDWCKEKITGKHHFWWEHPWFPVDFPLNQSIDHGLFMEFS